MCHAGSGRSNGGGWISISTRGSNMRLLTDIARDVPFALRVMRKSALATATIVLCLGFSIGATATVITWMESLVLRPVRGVPEIERLVSLKTTTPTSADGSISYPAFKDIRDDRGNTGGSLTALGTFSIRRFNLRTTTDDAERRAEPVWGLLTSANYFDMLRVRPQLGRGFLPGDDSVSGREP